MSVISDLALADFSSKYNLQRSAILMSKGVGMKDQV